MGWSYLKEQNGLGNCNKVEIFVFFTIVSVVIVLLLIAMQRSIESFNMQYFFACMISA
jgi:hypothetical protein